MRMDLNPVLIIIGLAVFGLANNGMETFDFLMRLGSRSH